MIFSEVKQCFEEIIANFDQYWRREYHKPYPNQTIESCLDLCRFCVTEDPDYVIEVGTNYGASTLALALAHKVMGKPLSIMTTIDLEHEFWKERTPSIQEEVVKKYDISIGDIRTITKDFTKVDPSEVISSGKGFIFYDMHDHQGPWSQSLLDKWYPLMSQGTIVVHDMTPVYDDFPLEDDKVCPRSKAKHFNGQMFAGFNECARIINWLNAKKIDLGKISGGIFFKK